MHVTVSDNTNPDSHPLPTLTPRCPSRPTARRSQSGGTSGLVESARPLRSPRRPGLVDPGKRGRAAKARNPRTRSPSR